MTRLLLPLASRALSSAARVHRAGKCRSGRLRFRGCRCTEARRRDGLWDHVWEHVPTPWV